ncbi:hypothetical protein AQUCO_00201116v1 [Aquilegia coerulea]|uniref:DDT domain-containing protein n=2 Tax=Aquilegia coerulea TaxID=218851 RepID=A0A2G5F6B3_AQUCA|nr:hypothetical protein AQUCO_00201116v1 [Aquilegia coerulea]
MLGNTCHQCRQKTMDFVAECKGQEKNKRCKLKFCFKCLLNRYGEEAEEVNKLEDWTCPKCRGICNCSLCMKKRGHQPTGILVHFAKATGYRSVSDMLDVNGTGKEISSDENKPKPDVDEEESNLKKITEDEEETQRSGVKGNVEDKPKPDVDIPLPVGIALTTVSNIELPAKDVGPALQFLEFCCAFQEVLELKNGEPELVLRELTSGSTSCQSQYSTVVRLHIQLLSLIQKDMGEECPLSPTSNGSSWLQALGKCISESQCEFKDLPSEFFDRGGDEYENLDSSTRLRLLNFICDEVLCTTDLRGWIDKQKEILFKRAKEAKEKILAAKDKERRLKKQMQNEFAKATLLNGGAPLSVSEHEDLVSRIKGETAKTHSEKLEAIGMVPKTEERSDAVRSEPVLLNENGLILWKLQSYSAEPKILLQDIGMDSEKREDKWFTYDAEQQQEVENYISFQRKKRTDCIKSKKSTIKNEVFFT